MITIDSRLCQMVSCTSWDDSSRRCSFCRMADLQLLLTRLFSTSQSSPGPPPLIKGSSISACANGRKSGSSHRSPKKCRKTSNGDRWEKGDAVAWLDERRRCRGVDLSSARRSYSARFFSAKHKSTACIVLLVFSIHISRLHCWCYKC